ncbi:hypothetical protein ACW14X_27910 [Nocardioides sp. YJ-D4]
MLLAHAIVIAEVRSYIAALADTATTVLGSVAYDRALIYLDSVHGNSVPGLTDVPVGDPPTLYRLALQAVTDLGTFGLDPLHIELANAYLADAWAVDQGAGEQGVRVLPAWIDPTEPS